MSFKSELTRVSQRVLRFLPDLEEDLRNANIQKSPVEYLAQAIFLSTLSAVMLGAGSAIVLTVKGKPNTAISIGIGFMALFMLLSTSLARPRQTVKSRAYRLEQSLIFSLEALKVETASGISFGEAMGDLAQKDYGEFSKEMKWVMSESAKHGLGKALEASARRNPSKIYRRVTWQIINSLETGASMINNLSFILNDLRKKQEIEAQRYGRSMEKKMIFYIMGAIVFPALSIILVQTMTSLGVMQTGLKPEGLYYGVFAFSFCVQLVFLYMIKFGKPTLLCDDVISPMKHKRLEERLKALVEFTGTVEPWRRYLARQAAYSFVATILLTVALTYFLKTPLPLLFAAAAVFVYTTAYTRLAYLADKRGSTATEYLPDALRMMATNMEAGISIDHALLMSAHQEFGVLGKEIKLMGMDMIKNLTFEEAIDRLKLRIKSEPLHMSANLISHGIKSGKNLSKSLYDIANTLQEREHVKQEIGMQMHAITTTLVLLIVVSMPLLFSCSIVASQVMGDFNEKFGKTLPDEIVAQSWIKPARQTVPIDFIEQYILANIFVTALLGSVMIGAATTGKMGEGLRYAFAMILFSEGIYLILKAVLSAKIGGAFV